MSTHLITGDYCRDYCTDYSRLL